MNKKWYRSKTLWINVIALAGILVQLLWSESIAKEVIAAEGTILAVINMILRAITKQGIEK